VKEEGEEEEKEEKRKRKGGRGRWGWTGLISQGRAKRADSVD
jgi:hypothetical protein